MVKRLIEASAFVGAAGAIIAVASACANFFPLERIGVVMNMLSPVSTIGMLVHWAVGRGRYRWLPVVVSIGGTIWWILVVWAWAMGTGPLHRLAESNTPVDHEQPSNDGSRHADAAFRYLELWDFDHALARRIADYPSGIVSVSLDDAFQSIGVSSREDLLGSEFASARIYDAVMQRHAENKMGGNNYTVDEVRSSTVVIAVCFPVLDGPVQWTTDRAPRLWREQRLVTVEFEVDQFDVKGPERKVWPLFFMVIVDDLQKELCAFEVRLRPCGRNYDHMLREAETSGLYLDHLKYLQRAPVVGMCLVK